MHTQRLLGVGLLALGLLGCDEGGESGAEGEAFSEATYYVVNTTDAPIVFSATRLFDSGAIELEIPAGESLEVDRVQEGTGGHTISVEASKGIGVPKSPAAGRGEAPRSSTARWRLDDTSPIAHHHRVWRHPFIRHQLSIPRPRSASMS